MKPKLGPADCWPVGRTRQGAWHIPTTPYEAQAVPASSTVWAEHCLTTLSFSLPCYNLCPLGTLPTEVTLQCGFLAQAREPSLQVAAPEALRLKQGPLLCPSHCCPCSSMC